MFLAVSGIEFKITEVEKHNKGIISYFNVHVVIIVYNEHAHNAKKLGHYYGPLICHIWCKHICIATLVKIYPQEKI